MTGFLAELFSLEGRVAVVTGGSSGIGEAMASALALAGAQVVIVARDPTRLSAPCKSLRAGGWGGAGPPPAGAALGEPTLRATGAGKTPPPPLASLSEEHWDLMVTVNLTAPF